MSENETIKDTEPMSTEELQKVLKVPPRDTTAYPDMDKETQYRAGAFLYKLNLLASGVDGNLQSLIWELYAKMDDYIHLNKKDSAYPLMQVLEDLKDYMQENKNMLFDTEETVQKPE